MRTQGRVRYTLDFRLGSEFFTHVLGVLLLLLYLVPLNELGQSAAAGTRGPDHVAAMYSSSCCDGTFLRSYAVGHHVTVYTSVVS